MEGEKGRKIVDILRETREKFAISREKVMKEAVATGNDSLGRIGDVYRDLSELIDEVIQRQEGGRRDASGR